MSTRRPPIPEVGLLECIATLREYLAEAHEIEIENDHGGDDPATCSYCGAIEVAGALLRRNGFEE